MKRLLSLALCAVLVLGIVFPVYAAEGSTTDPTQTSAPVIEACTVCGQTEGHAENCSQYVVPDDSEKTEGSKCTCDPAPAEGEVHSEGCALYVAPDDSKKTEGSEGDAQPKCVCDPAPTDGEAHAEGCPLAASKNTDSYKALYLSVMESTSFLDVYNMLMSLSDEELASFQCTFSEDELIAMNQHILALAENAKNNVTITDTVVIPNEEAVQVDRVDSLPQSYGYTNAAPFKPAAVGTSASLFSRMRSTALSAGGSTYDNRTEKEGVVTSKEVSDPDNDGVYTLTLESYVTGSKISDTVSEEVPTDIILVLDQSGSMKNDFSSTYTSYTAYPSSTTNADFYESGTNVYYKDGDKYVPVSIERVITSAEEKVFYSDPDPKTHVMYYSNRDNLVIQGETPDQDIPVTVEVSGFLTTKYTYKYGDTVKTYEGFLIGLSGSPDIPNLKIKSVDTVSEHSYKYMYTLSDGAVVEFTSSNDSGTVCTEQNVTFYKGTTSTQTVTRLSALQDAVQTFTDNVYAKAKGADGLPNTSDDINHRIAVVGFASGRYWNGTNYNYGNTELFVGSTEYTYNAGSNNDSGHQDSAQSHYDSAFQDMNTTAGYNNVIASKNALSANGGTIINLGMEMANGIFGANPLPSGEKRNRVVIVFTDGVPGWSGFESSVADSAVAEAAVTKNTYAATVYSVGIFNGADATSAGSSSSNATETQRANNFMQRLSSNNGTPQTPSYYLSASKASELKEIFEEISNNIESGGASISLDASTVIQDVISDYFTLPETDGVVDTSGIKVYTSDYTAEDTFTDKQSYEATVNVEGKTISVSGFDFSENWVGTETVNGNVSYRGKKLIIEIPVVPEEDFLGGNQVPTNTSASGVYNEDDLIESFEIPVADVPVKQIIPAVTDKDIYLSQSFNLFDLLNNEFDSRIDGTNNDYVGVSYTIKDGETVVASATIAAGTDKASATWTPVDLSVTPDADKTYTVTIAITPTTTGTATATNGEANAKVNVYLPFITFQDTAVAYNEQANFDNTAKQNRNLVSVAWKHGETVADATAMGAAPTLTYAYSSNGTVFTNSEPALTQETSVKVTVFIGQNDITQYVSFWRNKCEAENGCTFEGGSVSATDNNWVNFIVHIKTFDLTIVKQGVDQADAGAPFIFNIKGGNVDMNVVIYGNGRVTIKNLPAGNYTVEEVGGYWRYDITKATPSQSQSADAQNNTVTFTNTRTNNQWLDDFASATNKFTGATR